MDTSKISELWHDPLLYLNYAACALAFYMLFKYGKDLKDIDSFDRNPKKYLTHLFFMVIILGGLLYLSKELGDMSLDKLGVKP